MKIALISLDQYWEDKSKNLTKSEKLLKKASLAGAQLAIFPEMTLSGYSFNYDLAEDFSNSESIAAFKKLAKTYKISVVFGLLVKNANKALNRAVCLNGNGDIVGYYDKMHPFSFANEDEMFDAGKEVCVMNCNGVNVGVSICYDLRFPEIFSMTAAKTELFINIANWPAKRVEHFKTLLKARAIENQAFMIGVNRIGKDGNGISYSKSSVCFDPFGNRQKPIFTSRELDIVEIDVTIAAKYREEFSCVKDKRFSLYTELITEQLK